MEELQQNEALLDEQLLAEPDSELLSDEEGEEGGLYEHFNVTVDKGQSLLRLDKFLKARMERSSRNRIQAAIDSGNVLVNGSPSKSSYKVKPLDYIQVVMPYPRRDNSLIPQDIPLEIPYEDDDLLLVNKPAGMVVHPVRDVPEQPFHILRSGTAQVHGKACMLGGNGCTTHLVALQTSLVNKRCGITTYRTLKCRASRRQIQRLGILALTHKLSHLCSDLFQGLGFQFKDSTQYD